jgi:hypothetical protein
MTLPGYTAEVTLYRSTQAYRLSVASGGSTERVQPALNPLTIISLPGDSVGDVLSGDNYNRCGCWDAYLDCTYKCEFTDSRPFGECMPNCRTSLANCYAYCSFQRIITLPPGVVGRLGP